MEKLQTASELYALSQGSRCEGRWLCHWCGAKCGDRTPHDDLPEMPGTPRNKSLAKRPADPWMCNGCKLWRRGRLTITYMHGDGSMDGQEPRNHSWLITPEWASAVHPAGSPDLAELLMKPPVCFALMLLSEPILDKQRPRAKGAVLNQIHRAGVNDLPELKAETPIKFTLDNIPHTYTVYELEQAFVTGPDGKEPGVRALFHLFGLSVRSKEEEEKRGRGRPEPLANAKTTTAKQVKRSAA